MLAGGASKGVQRKEIVKGHEDACVIPPFPRQQTRGEMELDVEE